MAPKDQEAIEIELVIANDQRTDEASGDGGPHQRSSTVKLLSILLLLARQTREWHQAVNDDRDISRERPKK